MNVYFNELTLSPISDVNAGAVFLHSFLTKTWKKFNQKTKLKHILCNDHNKISEKCLNQKNGILNQLFYSVFRAPYVDGEIHADVEARYLKSKFYINIDDQANECHDFGCAIINGTMTMGLPSIEFWKDLNYTVYEISGNDRQEHNAFCITQESHIEEQDCAAWINEFFFHDPIQTDISPDKKEINIRQDHGNDILYDFALRLRNSRYVIAVVNSLEWRGAERRFIRSCSANGLIELRLHWTDNGLGMIVKTTGENIYQTRQIAEILKREYDQRT